MIVSKRMQLIPPSGTMSMLEKAQRMTREGRRVLHMEVGDPDFETPQHIKDAAYHAIQSGLTHYSSSKGLLELREAISEDLKKRGIDADPDNEIIVTPGTKHALYCACQSTLNPQEESIILAPTWPTHFVSVQASEAKPVEVPLKTDHRLNEEGVKNSISNKTKMIIINSPNNPTGDILTRDEVRTIADLAKDHDLLVLTDEIYDRLVYDGYIPTSMASIDGMMERTITLNGFSKAYAMTGWRLGYAVADKEIVEAIQRIQQNTTTCAATFVQMAGLKALKGPQECVEHMVKEYDLRRRTIVQKLDEIPEITCPIPKGAFYVFPDVSNLNLTSTEMAKRLLEKEGVCSTGGSVFGNSGEGHIRLSFATDLNTISEAMEKINHFVTRTILSSA